MKLGLVSDTHCRHGNKLPEIPDGLDVLVMAGDICDSDKFSEATYHIDTPIIYVAGNHEYYGNSYQRVYDEHFSGSGIGMDCATKTINGIDIHVATMWTEMPEESDWVEYVNSLNDYRMIGGFSVDIYRNAFKSAIDYFKSNCKEGDIIVTHHMPSFQAVAPQYEGVSCNKFFASDLDDMILKLKPSHWLFGHTHTPCDFMIGNTRLVANPKGYPNENIGEYKVKVIDIN